MPGGEVNTQLDLDIVTAMGRYIQSNMPMCTFDGFVCVTTGMCSEHLVMLFYSPYFTVLLASRPLQRSSLATQNPA